MSEKAVPYSRSDLHPLLRCMVIAAIVAGICFVTGPIPKVQNNMDGILHFIPRLVPTVAAISRETSNPMASEIVLAIQWLFAPAYLFIWFHSLPPWSRRMRVTITNVSGTLTDSRRFIGVPFGILFLGAWLLGDANRIAFPTFYNGKYVYPPSHAVPQFRVIYESRVALVIYAWLGPFIEATIIWMFSMLVVNAKTYLVQQKQEEIKY